jgi:predicted nucleic acid-binding protein
MSEKLFVDTSYVIALVNTRDQYHGAAEELTEKYQGWPLVTTEAVLLEIAGALSARYKKAAISIIDAFISNDDVDVIPFSNELFSKSLGLYKKYVDKEWSLVDCISFLVMRDKKIIAALSSDSHFKQAGFDPLLIESNR